MTPTPARARTSPTPLKQYPAPRVVAENNRWISAGRTSLPSRGSPRGTPRSCRCGSGATRIALLRIWQAMAGFSLGLFPGDIGDAGSSTEHTVWCGFFNNVSRDGPQSASAAPRRGDHCLGRPTPTPPPTARMVPGVRKGSPLHMGILPDAPSCFCKGLRLNSQAPFPHTPKTGADPTMCNLLRQQLAILLDMALWSNVHMEAPLSARLFPSLA